MAVSQKMDSIAFEQEIVVLDSLFEYGEYDKILLEVNRLFDFLPPLSERQKTTVMARKAGALIKSNPDSAQIILQKSKDYFVSIHDTINLNYAFILDALGVLETINNEYASAESFYLKGRSIRERILGKKHPDYATSLFYLGALNQRMGKYNQAENFLLEAIEIQKEVLGEDHLSYGYSIGSLASLYDAMSKLEQAEELFLKALEIQRKKLGKEHNSYGKLLNDLAVFYIRISKYNKAEILLIESIEIRASKNGKESSSVANSYNNLGYLYLQMGMYLKAEHYLSESIEINEKIFGEEHPNFLGSLINYAAFYMEMGQYEQAETLLLRTKNNLKKEHPYYSFAVRELGRVYKLNEKYEQAELLFLETIEIQKKTLGENHSQYVISLIALGRLYLNLEQYTKAERMLTIGLEKIKNEFGEAHQNFTNVLSNIAIINDKTGKKEEAIELYLKVREIEKKIFGADHPNYASTLIGLANSYYQLGNYNQALSIAIDNINLRQKLLKNAFNFLSEIEKTKYQQRVISDFDLIKSLSIDFYDANLYSNLYDLSLFEKGIKLNSSIQTRQYIFSLQDSELQDKYNDFTRYHQLLSKEYEKPIDKRKEVDTIKHQITLIEKELARASAQFRSEQQLNNIDATKLRTALQDDEIAIEFTHFRYKKNETDSIIYAACVLDPTLSEILFIPLFEENNPLVVPLNKKIKKGQIKRLYNFIDPSFAVKGDQKTLYELVWAPLDSLLENKKRIYYSPSGLLYRLNLNAIPIDAQTVMGDQYEMYNLSSTKLIAVENEVERNQMAYIVGDVTYDLNTDELVTDSTTTFPTYFSKVNRSLRGGNWQDLPATKEETLTINNKLEKANYQVTLKTKDNATEESFKALGTTEKSPRVIHLATHGFFFPDPENKNNSTKEPVFKISENPMLRSGIILAGANHTWEGKGPIFGKEDGVLTAYEISHMNLSNTELVVLSACKTGLGDIEGSEGVYGLQRAFKKAGVKYLVMSLWEVDDEKTAVFMTAFYKNWLEKEMSIRAAFNTTQLEMKNKYANPLDWAGFVLIE